MSLLIHVGALGTLGAITLHPDVRETLVKRLDAAMIDAAASARQAEEPLHILAEPLEAPQEEATALVQTLQPGAGNGLGMGSGPTSLSSRVGVAASISERTSLPAIHVLPEVAFHGGLPRAPMRDLGGLGGVVGDVTFETQEIGQALDQLAREILRHLQEHRLTVVWLFDESESMRDDQRAIKEKFDRVAGELKIQAEPKNTKKRAAAALSHAIVGFGQGIHYLLEKPTLDIDAIGRSIDRLPVDETGIENTMHAIADVIQHYSRLIGKDRRLLVVLVTDESGDDGDYVEEARQAALSQGVPIYVIGRQALFGLRQARVLWIDPVTKEHHYPTIRRGPETADIEVLQWDGLHERRDEWPSGFAPYELARLTKDTGGIYFLLPNEETLRVRRREKAYSIATLKEYVPDYAGRLDYVERRNHSPLRSVLYQVIQATKGFSSRLSFPVEPGARVAAAPPAAPPASLRLQALAEIEQQLRGIKKYRDREPEKRWQANYDLTLAQIVVAQVKLYEYRACLLDLIKTRPRPQVKPEPGQRVTWEIGHSKTRQAPKAETEKKYAEAEHLLKLVSERHPDTPWADLAQAIRDRGLSVARRATTHRPPDPNRQPRPVPKF
ncbi:MAG: VWA domain-containing protein [Isosphaeraceae bacterium]|nr:VWA domain-containing protein [Isosphaeraceae bacterium]